jgi:hypothetical protein
MEQKLEREWKTIVCPDGNEKATVMYEWDILSEEGRIFRKTLRKIDCHNPKLSEFGGADCNWACKKATAKEEITELGMKWLLVCAIIIGGFAWIVFYGIHIRPYFHWYGFSLLFGIPLFMGLILYCSWKIMKYNLMARV